MIWGRVGSRRGSFCRFWPRRRRETTVQSPVGLGSGLLVAGVASMEDEGKKIGKGEAAEGAEILGIFDHLRSGGGRRPVRGG